MSQLRPTVIYPNPPDYFDQDEARRLLLFCHQNNVQDINILSDKPVVGRVHGWLCPVTERPLTPAEIEQFATLLYDKNAVSTLAGGKPIDTAFELRPERNKRFRFRVNMIQVERPGGTGTEITMRSLPIEIPSIADLEMEAAIVENFAPHQGLILVTGPTGSGKSTTQASLNRNLLESGIRDIKLKTFEKPIEYVYDMVKAPHCIVEQSEVPRDVPSFAAGLENALRENPDCILIGESRDLETMSTTIDAALTGHTVYTTLHTNGVAETIQRVTGMFPDSIRQERVLALLESLHMIVSQTLVQTMDGRRAAAREFLVFDQDIRRHLADAPLAAWPTMVRRLTAERGQSMLIAIGKLFRAGRIEERTLKLYERRFGTIGADIPLAA